MAGKLTYNQKQFSFILLFFSMFLSAAFSQDSLFEFQRKTVTLKEVVVRNNLNAAAFIERVQQDTSFYKAFRNLRVLGFTALNDIQLFNKKKQIKASLSSRTQQHTSNGCRWTDVIEEKYTGDFYDRHHQYNYYSAEMYAALFFAADTICGETNIVGNTSLSTKGKSGLSKHKEQLKMLFFNPGKKIPGIPFIGNKIALFDEEVARLYDFTIDVQSFNGDMCYVFIVKPRNDLSNAEKNDIVINEMTTFFRIENWNIVARQYDLSYNAGVYDFDVHMEAELTNFGEYLVPTVLRYNGTWDVAFKKRERAVFTATLFDFNVD